jgi:hypothetical protein
LNVWAVTNQTATVQASFKMDFFFLEVLTTSEHRRILFAGASGGIEKLKLAAEKKLL